MKTVFWLLGAIVICIVAVVLLLPHSSTSSTGGQQPGSPQNISNVTNPSTTVAPSATANQTYNTTTVTSNQTGQSAAFNYSQYINQLDSTYGLPTTTVLYVYCVGSLLPPFNQSYYSATGESGAINWNATTGYPVPFSGGSCASAGSWVYCLGDSQIFSNLSKDAYYAPISAAGIGSWQATTDYPVPFSSGSCSAYDNYVYCVGTSDSTYSKDVFYAPIVPSGVGAWSATTNYPAPFYGGQCNAYNGYIYCIGDTYINVSSLVHGGQVSSANQVFAGVNLSFDYYAPVSPAGVGQWRRIRATPQPVNGGSCTIANTTIYCVGGSSAFMQVGSLAESGNLSASGGYISNLSSNDSSASFFAQIGADGAVGNWSYGAEYPNLLQGGQCASDSNDIYCVGGTGGPQVVAFSQLSPSSGIDSWFNTTEYPMPFYYGYCSSNSKD